MVYNKDSVHVPQLLFISGCRCSLVLRAHHLTAASRADHQPGEPSTSDSAVSALMVETSTAGEGTEQPRRRACCSTREMAGLKSQLQIKAGSTLCVQLILGLGVQSSCQKAKLASRVETVSTGAAVCVRW